MIIFSDKPVITTPYILPYGITHGAPAISPYYISQVPLGVIPQQTPIKKYLMFYSSCNDLEKAVNTWRWVEIIRIFKIFNFSFSLHVFDTGFLLLWSDFI